MYSVLNKMKIEKSIRRKNKILWIFHKKEVDLKGIMFHNSWDIHKIFIQKKKVEKLILGESLNEYISVTLHK